MGDVRKDYRVEPNKDKKENKDRKVGGKGYDPLAFPFGSDEALLNGELAELDREDGR